MAKTFHTREEEGVLILEPIGRFDANIAPDIQHWLTARLKENHAHILVNLGQVPFIDTRALSTLVTTMKHCRQQHGDLRLCALQKPVRIIFELSQLDRAFALFSDEEEGVASFKGAAKTAVSSATIIQGVPREPRSLYDSPRVAGA